MAAQAPFVPSAASPMPGRGGEGGGSSSARSADASALVELTSLSLLVIEDDEGDAVYLAAAFEDAGVRPDQVRWFTTLSDGQRAIAAHEADCVLVDLGLPDASGLQSVSTMVQPDGAAVIVLTGLHGTSGEPALAIGAQDYLVKDDLRPEALSRAIRYAVERKRAERTRRALHEERVRAGENARLERGLLPRPILDPRRVEAATMYRSGQGHTLLGGDFYDIVERADGSVRAVIGDVMGHGPDEAAVGVQLRVAWRSLVLAGIADADVMRTLDMLLTAEAVPGSPFVTACDITISADLSRVAIRSAGHPAPIVVAAHGVTCPEMSVMPPLGVGRWHDDAETVVELGAAWQLALYTDGLLDSFRHQDDPRDIGFDGLLQAATAARSADPHEWVRGILARAPRVVTDDMAVVALAPGLSPRRRITT